MNISQWLVRPFTHFAERYYPDPFVFAVLMTGITFVFALLLTDATPASALTASGDGLPKLLAFTAQLCITLLAAHALAHTDQVQGLLRWVGSLPKSSFSAYALVAFSAGAGSLIAWSRGLIVGAMVARQVAIECQKRGVLVHYPLLVASAYGGFVIWHMGYSASAALFVATPGHSLESAMGVLPITETIFTIENGVLALITLLAVTFLCPMMRPQDIDVLEIDIALIKQDEEPSIPEATNATPASKLENMRLLSSALGGALLLYIAYSFYVQGFFLTLDIVNWSFVGAGLLLARSPLHYVRLIENASKTVGPIILQYPFYAGILGMMIGTGLVNVISDWFASTATADTLSLAAFLSAGLVNIFIPSGGGRCRDLFLLTQPTN